jgi:DNA polymerase III delta prime subunit
MSEMASQAFKSGADRIAQTLSDWRRQLLDTSKISKLINCKFSRGSGSTSAGGALLLEHPATDQLWDAMAVQEKSAAFAWASTLLPTASSPSVVDSGSIPGEIDTNEFVAPSSTRANLTPEEIQCCLASTELRADELLTGLFDKRLDATLKRMSLTAQTSLSEQGINSLFLAFGFIRWFESADSEVELISPLLLMPVALSKEHGQSTWLLRPLDEEITTNHSLTELFRSDFRVVLPDVEDQELRGSPETFANYLQSVRGVIAGQTRWSVDARAALGSFGFQKISMWQDLRRNEGRIIDHGLCRSIAGDMDAMAHGESINGSDDPMALASSSASDGEDSNPAEHNLILDCDGSQLAAVTAVKNGSHLILDGPPGTGKSQTIANMIAETLAAGKTVLFVSEKSAALEVVKRRLDAKKIGDFCLECHSHKSNKRAVIEELGRCLNHEPERYPSQGEKLGELNRCRQTLNRYVRALHAVRSELGLSAYQMHARLASLQSPPVSRVNVVEPHQITKGQLQAMEEAVARLTRFEAIIAQRGEHSWKGCRPELITLSFVDDAEHHFHRAADVLERRRLAAASLVELGLLCESFTEAQLQHARQTGKAAARFPFVPEGWISRGLRETAGAYIRLDELASEFRIALTAADTFSRPALSSAPVGIFQSTDQLARDLRPLVLGLPTTLREVPRHFSDVRAQVSAALATIGPLVATAGALLNLLGLQESRALTASDIQSVAAAGRCLEVSGKVPDAWFDAARRAQLKKAYTEAQQAANFAQLARKPLENRLQPLAFTAAIGAIVQELLRHSSFFAQWGGSWRRARRAFVALYTCVPPNRSGLLDDAFLLKKYQAAVDRANSTAESAADSDWNGSIDFDWQAAGARLEQFDSIAPVLLQSPGFAAAAVQLDAAAVARIRSGVSDVERSRSAFDSAFGSLSLVLAVPAALGVEQPAELDLQELRKALESLEMKLTAAEAAVATCVNFLAEGADLRLGQLGRELDVLITLRNLHQEASVAAGKVGEPIAPIDVGNLGDHRAQAELEHFSSW